MAKGLRVAGLFAGIGGIERGLHLAGHTSEFLCEIDPGAQTVLRHRFQSVPLADDVRKIRALPNDIDLLAAGFPCTDISQAGRTAGITGLQSGLVAEVFRLVQATDIEWLLIENVQNMLALGRGAAMSLIVGELERLGMRWAYRLVDSRFTGVAQRRRRVILLASRKHDPRQVLFADEALPIDATELRTDAFGFYWTEGLRGLGWAQDAVPTIKGGSTIGISSPPAVWVPGNKRGRRLLLPSVEDLESLQGFPRGWTSEFQSPRAQAARMKMVGNAVTVGVAHWVGDRLAAPGEIVITEECRLSDGARWPSAAWGEEGSRWRVAASEYPIRKPYGHLLDVLDGHGARPISLRAANGFLERTRNAKLKFDPSFIEDVECHIRDLSSIS